MPEEVPGKKAISCSEIGIIKDRDFRVIGDTVEEVIEKLYKHLKENHSTAIPPGSELDRVVRKFIHYIEIV